MLQSTYKGVKEGLLKVVTGSVMLGVLPLQLLAPVSLAQSVNEDVWQTQLTIATTEPVLLADASSAPVIQKVTSRYDEEQARIAAEAAKAAAAARKKAQVKTVTLASFAPVTVKTIDVPFAQKEALVNKAGAMYNVPAKLLLAVWLKESGWRWYFAGGSSVGARGPAQFMPGTWKSYGVDGNGDGVKDIANAEDAIPAMARYLAANGANRGDYVNALYRYNHSTAYVNSVLAMAGL